MDQITLVDRRIDDGEKFILQLARDGFEVTAAFWLKAPEDPGPHLYIASPLVQDIGPTEGYRRLQESIQRLRGTSLSLLDVKLIGVKTPIARGVRLLQRQTVGNKSIHLSGGQISNVAIDEAYIYPSRTGRPRSLKLLMLDEPMTWLTTVNGAAPVAGGQYTPPVTFAGTHNVDDPTITCTLIGPMQSDSSPATVVNQSWSHTYDALDAGSYVFVATIEGSSASTGPFPFFV